MSNLNIHLPNSLHKNLRKLVQHEAISIEQFIAKSVAEKMAALMTETYLEERAKRGSRAQYDVALSQVPDVEPEEYDRLPG